MSQSLESVPMFHRTLVATLGSARASHVWAAFDYQLLPYSLHFLVECSPAGGEIDEGVPDTLKWKHATAGDTELEADLAAVSETVESVDGTWYPSNENGKGEDEASAQVSHLHGIQMLELE